MHLQDDFWICKTCSRQEWEGLVEHMIAHQMSFMRVLNFSELQSIQSGQVVARRSTQTFNGKVLLEYDPIFPFLFSHQVRK